MRKVMTCGCSNSRYTLTVLYLMGLAGIEILSGLHHLLEIVSIRARTLPLMDARCTLALPQMTFIWIIRPCRLLYYCLAFSAFVCLFLVVLFLLLDFFKISVHHPPPKKKKKIAFKKNFCAFGLPRDSKQKSHFKLNSLICKKNKQKEITQIAVHILICSIIMARIFLSSEGP